MKSHIIGLDMLTPEELKQFDENKTVLADGDADAALYLRFSSDKQTEQSIEGQLRDAISFCKLRGYRVRAVYVDRATSASKDIEKRTGFMQMIADSSKRHWQTVLVWKLDRFARNRNDSAIYKTKLKKNGVKVVSVTENISDNPEGIILESVLEGMAEFYSAELSQKITRGLRESALKCNSVGGRVPLGYKIENHKFVIDPVGADIVREAFHLYAQGHTIADICRYFNGKGYKSSKDAIFTRSSFKSMLKNKRYIGVYKYKDIEVEDGMPAIVDKEVFEEVQLRLKKNGSAPARGKAKANYLLSGKLFCGHCGSNMVGECGRSRTGEVYHYYACFDHKRGGRCDKKAIRKEIIEDWVVEDAYALLSRELIEEIADIAVAQTEAEIAENTKLPELTSIRAEKTKTINNIVAAIERGAASDTLIHRLSDLERDVKALNEQIAEEEKEVIRLDRAQVVYWLNSFAQGDKNDEKFRQQLVDLLINSVTVWDLPDGTYKITTAYNLSSRKTHTFNASEKFGFRADNSTTARSVEHFFYKNLFVLASKI